MYALEAESFERNEPNAEDVPRCGTMTSEIEERETVGSFSAYQTSETLFS